MRLRRFPRRRTSPRSGLEVQGGFASTIAPVLALLVFAMMMPAPAKAAVPALIAGTVTGAAASTVDLSVSFASGTTPISALAFDLSLPAALSCTSTTSGDAAIAAGKSAQGSIIAGGVRILVFGINQTGIGSGTVAVMRLNISANAVLGALVVGISNISMSDPAGISVPSSGSAGSVIVTDMTAPLISAVTTGGVTSSAATVSWVTSEPTNSQVEYGTSLTYGNSTTLDPALVTSHAQVLSGLSAGTVYHYRIKSRDASGNLAISGDFTFTTTAATDPGALAITEITSSGVTSTTVTITWSTNKPSSSQVEYGTSEYYGSSTELDPTVALAHSQTIKGLSANTTYHYRVKSRDESRNLVISGDYTFATPANTDTTPPVISSVKASSVSSSGATVSWFTDEPSDSQVEYGTSASYGSATVLSSAATTAHSQAIVGLTAKTTYHYRVKSRDSAGNAAVSGDFTFTTTALQDTTPPVIKSLGDFGTSSSGARIVWTTDEASDSLVEYGISDSYGTVTSVNPRLDLTHSQVLKGLKPETTYHYRVRSKDAAGNLAVSGDRTFQTAGGPDTKAVVRVLRYPRTVIGSKTQPGAYEDEYTGLGLVNLDRTAAVLKFTCFNQSGTLIEAPDILNPATFTVTPGRQLAVLDTDLFGPGLLNQDTGGWIVVESSVERVAGFFLMLNARVSVLDGTNIPTATLTSFVLPEVDAQGQVRIELANPNNDPAAVTLELIGADGHVRSTAQRTIAGLGFDHCELFTDIFSGLASNDSDYVRIRSSLPILSVQVVGRGYSYIEVLEGQDATRAAATLYSPQFVYGGNWNSSLALINLDSRPGTVTLRLIGDDGSQLGKTKAVPIGAGGKISISGASFFDAQQPAAPNSFVQGYLIIDGGDIRLAGSVSYGDVERSKFSTALPLVSSLARSMLFAHIASNSDYFMGLSLLNPNETDAHVMIGLYNSNGEADVSTNIVLGAHERRIGLLTEFFPGLAGQTRSSGYVKIISDQDLAGFAVFGKTDLSSLASIPAQPQP